MGSNVTLALGVSWWKRSIWKREKESAMLLLIPGTYSKIKMMLQGAERKVPYQVNHPENFGSTGFDDLNYTLIITIELNALGCPKGPPQMACNINTI